ncbi:hypothetical protein H1C71_021370 [Ictidomys tridecemlineatus]|nr:hypothetical protein H1C71_021370 [Ictidomys tridecemlineatus]KAG3268377.1 hypothetical protein H1C71_021370 [Ictidomys tridecemlineatus]KAG3268378.1 hypothetical protein H1C71_021370 [Ictidomys tridecemlineatus]
MPARRRSSPLPCGAHPEARHPDVPPKRGDQAAFRALPEMQAGGRGRGGPCGDRGRPGAVSEAGPQKSVAQREVQGRRHSRCPRGQAQSRATAPWCGCWLGLKQVLHLPAHPPCRGSVHTGPPSVSAVTSPKQPLAGSSPLSIQRHGPGQMSLLAL